MNINRLILIALPAAAVITFSSNASANCGNLSEKFSHNTAVNNGRMVANNNFRGRGTAKSTTGLISSSPQGVSCKSEFHRNTAINNGRMESNNRHSGSGTSSASTHLIGIN